MKEYIERDAALDACFYGWNNNAHDCAENIRSIPAADVRPVVRGQWVDEPIKGIRYHCSVCQGRFDYTWHYCPNCGARMEENNERN